ncbi:hypothetical protein ACIRG5_15180 [Lentzea sp. NPDC102401]|uniref:hypothetical protein n=1 Tax=Lentzea sp. NPDC102401 TaxID=3364128 RepID=UPI0038158278
MLRNLICLFVVAAVAGCSSPPPSASPPSSAAPDPAAVQAWVDQVCAADKPIRFVSAVVSTAPKFTPGQRPTEADRPAVIASLTKLRDVCGTTSTTRRSSPPRASTHR